MFTGIIQDKGIVKHRDADGDSIRFMIKPVSGDFTYDVKPGDSISVNGACMTAETISSEGFSFTAIKETLKKTNLGKLEADSVVNLEKAMTMNSKLDGHIVQGHVDTTGKIKKIKTDGTTKEYHISFSKKFRDNLIHVGSIAINGVSLTIADIRNNDKNTIIKIAIIPHTFEATNFSKLKKGDLVNIEFDMIGKYVKSILKKAKK